MAEAWKRAVNWRVRDDLIPVIVTYPDGRSDTMPSGAAALLLATRIFYRLGAAEDEDDDKITVEDALARARDRVRMFVLNGDGYTLDDIRVTLQSTTPNNGEAPPATPTQDGEG